MRKYENIQNNIQTQEFAWSISRLQVKINTTFQNVQISRMKMREYYDKKNCTKTTEFKKILFKTYAEPLQTMIRLTTDLSTVPRDEKKAILVQYILSAYLMESTSLHINLVYIETE